MGKDLWNSHIFPEAKNVWPNFPEQNLGFKICRPKSTRKAESCPQYRIGSQWPYL